MTSVWRERAWKLAFYAALLVVTWLGVAREPPDPSGAIEFAFKDKLQHVLLFAALGLLGARAYRDRPRWGIVVALAFYGFCIELAQLRTGRHFDMLDALANAIGACAAFLMPRAAASRS